MSQKVLFHGFLVTVVVLVGCRPEENVTEKFGQFKGNVVAEWDGGGRTMKLVRDFSYTDPQGKHWHAPVGAVVDGASIPKAFWSFIGGPFEGQYRRASVVHDVACQEKEARWQDVHLMFYNACRCGGVGEGKAKVMYYAVYNGGPRWPPKSARNGKLAFKLVLPSFDNVSEQQLKKIQQYIETQNPSLEELRTLEPDSPKFNK